MRKNRIFGILLLTILFLLPFGNYANAQVPNYVGVDEGDQYTWDAEVNFDIVDSLLDNVRDVLVDLQTDIDLGGLESLTVAEIYEQIANIYLSNTLPVGWEGFNISTLVPLIIEDYIVSFNSTVLSGMIPSNWQALNFSDFYDLVVDGLNSTLPATWEADPLPALFKMLINEFNSTIFYGLIPAGWEDLTVEELLEALMLEYAPAMGESVVFRMMFEELISLENLITLDLPPEILTYTLSEIIDELVNTLRAETTLPTATELFEQLFLFLNQSIPGGMESETMESVIDLLNEGINNATSTIGFDSLSMTEIVQNVTLELSYITIPPEFHGKTIQEIVDLALTEALYIFDNEIMQGWGQAYLYLQASGLVSYKIGLRAVINNIGIEIQPYSGGPMGVPFDMDVLYSLDFENWIDLSLLLEMGLPIDPIIVFPFLGMDPGSNPLIMDPSTYLSVQTALMDQFMLSGALVVANNYDWETIETETTIATTGNPDSIEMSVEWNSNGVLKSVVVQADGQAAVMISLIGAEGVEGEIPGFEIPILLGFTGLTIIAIVFYRKRKINIIK